MANTHALGCVVLALRLCGGYGIGLEAHPEWEKTIMTQGYNVIRNVLSAAQLRQAQRILRDRWLQTPPDKFGRERQYALLELDPVFGEFLEAIPKSLETWMGQVMGPWVIGAFDIYKFHPVRWNVPGNVRVNNKAMSLHSDFPYGHHQQQTSMKKVPDKYPPTVQLIFMVTDFTADNGATVVLPGSHKGRRLPQGLNDRLPHMNRTRYVTGKAGDLIVYIGQTWHGNDINTAYGPRIGVIAQCLPWYFKPMQSFMYTLPYRVEKQLSPRVRMRLGLKFSHFFGHTITMGYNTVLQRAYHHWSFLWDMLYEGYRTPGRRALFRRWALVALSVPAALFLAARFEALRLVAALLIGMFLGTAMTMERFGF